MNNDSRFNRAVHLIIDWISFGFQPKRRKKFGPSLGPNFSGARQHELLAQRFLHIFRGPAKLNPSANSESCWPCNIFGQSADFVGV